MQKGKWLTAGILAATCGLPLQVHAQYSGPSEPTASPKVSEILKAPKDDQDVMLQGKILRKLGDEKYVFSDGSGEIVVEIDDDDFPRDPIDENTRVELRGEVDTGRDRPAEIEVDSVRVLK